MIYFKLDNAASHNITVTDTATTVLELINTAGSTTHDFPVGINGLDLKVESGSIRIAKDNDPTSSTGYLIGEGEIYALRGVSLSSLKMIRAGSGDASVSVQVGQAVEGETTQVATSSLSGGSDAPMFTAPGALGEGYFSFVDAAFEAGDSPATHDINDALGRNAQSGYIDNYGSGALTFTINEGAGAGDSIRLEPGDTHNLENDNVDTIVVTHVADTSYKIYAK